MKNQDGVWSSLHFNIPLKEIERQRADYHIIIDVVNKTLRYKQKAGWASKEEMCPINVTFKLVFMPMESS